MFSFFKKKERVSKTIGRKGVTLEDFSEWGIPKGTVVTIYEVDSMRGYGFHDDDGHRVCETGWHSVKLIDGD